LILGFFRQYDYGFLKNLMKYGNTKPPEYNFAVITSPVSLIVGPNDWLATPEVSESFSALLPNLVFVAKAVTLLG
jgi:lysosomal acid lipase/cholesteryl ester hydrolase